MGCVFQPGHRLLYRACALGLGVHDQVEFGYRSTGDKGTATVPSALTETNVVFYFPRCTLIGQFFVCWHMI